MEMAVPLVQEFNALEREGIVVFNAFLQCKVIVVAPILSFLCDNPRGAEICSQLGATAVMYWRICTVSATLHSDVRLHLPKKNHVKVDVSSGLQGIGNLRTKTATVAQIQRIQSLPTKRERKQMQTQLGTSCKPNPMLELAVDAHQYVVCIYKCIFINFNICRSTPVEALHTLVLGPYKYMLRSLMARFSPHQRKEVLAHIASFPLSGFELRLSRDISKYYKSFVGRDFKTLAQLALFVFSPLVSPGETEVWLALSKVHVIVCVTHLYTYLYRCSSLYIVSGLHLTRLSP